MQFWSIYTEIILLVILDSHLFYIVCDVRSYSLDSASWVPYQCSQNFVQCVRRGRVRISIRSEQATSGHRLLRFIPGLWAFSETCLIPPERKIKHTVYILNDRFDKKMPA